MAFLPCQTHSWNTSVRGAEEGGYAACFSRRNLWVPLTSALDYFRPEDTKTQNERLREEFALQQLALQSKVAEVAALRDDYLKLGESYERLRREHSGLKKRIEYLEHGTLHR